MNKSLLASLLGFFLCVNLVFAAVKPGDKAPDFKLTNAKGETVSLADYPNQIVVLEWSNFDCPFVKKHYNSGNIPKMQKAYTDEDIVWLTIFSSAPGKQGNYPGESLTNKAKEMGNKASDLLRDEDGAVGKQYGAKTTPQFVVIDEEGIVAYTGAIDSIPSTNEKDISNATNYVSGALDALKGKQKVKVASTAPYGCSVKYQ